MVVEQIAGGVVERGHGQLIVDLGQDETLLGLSELGLSVQYKKYRLSAELVFAFVGVEGLLSQVHGDFRSLHGELGLFERVDGVGDFKSDALVRAALLILVAGAVDQSVGEVGLGRM